MDKTREMYRIIFSGEHPESIEKLIAIRFSLFENGIKEKEAYDEISGFIGEHGIYNHIKSCLKLGYLKEKTRKGKKYYVVNKEKLYS